MPTEDKLIEYFREIYLAHRTRILTRLKFEKKATTYYIIFEYQKPLRYLISRPYSRDITELMLLYHIRSSPFISYDCMDFNFELSLEYWKRTREKRRKNNDS